MSTIAEKLTLLLNTKSALKASLIEKGQNVTEENVFADYADKVRAIETGIDTSDATATAEDIASGKTAYVGGELVTGSVAAYGDGEGVYTAGDELSGAEHFAILKRIFTGNQLFRTGSNIRLYTPLSGFGDATAADVAEGKTFTSAEGVKVNGKCRLGVVGVYSSGASWFVPVKGSKILEFDVPHEDICPGNVAAIVVRRYGSFEDTGYNFAEMAIVYVDCEGEIWINDVIGQEEDNTRIYGTLDVAITGRHVTLDLSPNEGSDLRWASGYLIYALVTGLSKF